MGIGIKRSETGGSGAGAAKMIFDALSNFSPINRMQDALNNDALLGDKEPILSLDMDDAECLQLASAWKTKFDKYYTKIKTKAEENKKYYLGKQYGFDNTQYNGVDNVIFESTETSLPMMTRQNPDPVSECPEEDIAADINHIISKIADAQSLKTKLRQSARIWMLNYLGCVKVGWNFEEDDVEYTVVKTDTLVVDPSGNFDGGEFTGKYIGEPKSETAEVLVTRFPEKAEDIRTLVGGKMGTEVKYMEWWTDDYVFWSYGGTVLGKHKNPHWNYEEDQKNIDDTGEETITQVQTRKNHFKRPKKPYSFIWMFNLGEQPHDETSLIEQARPLQDMVNKKDRQIDKNADDSNNGWVLSAAFSEDQAKKALTALRNGGAVITPSQSIDDSVKRFPATSFPSYIINDMYDKREQIRNIMGIRGSSAAGVVGERTVRGKIQIQQQDVDRLSAIVEQIEQTSDYLYNYTLQMVYVYYTEKNLQAKIGDRAQAMMAFIQNPNSPEVVVSVKEGSMIPQDPLIKRSEAVDLASAGLIDPLTMFERMDFPNPDEATQRLIQYKTDPPSLLGTPTPPPEPQMPTEQPNPLMQ